MAETRRQIEQTEPEGRTGRERRRAKDPATSGTGAGRRSLPAVLVAIILVATLAAIAPAQPAGAAVSGITSGGSILYTKNSNLWFSSPDGATQRQVTTDGTTETADFTGSGGYTSPSQSDAGDVLVAVRNEGRTGDFFRLDGYLWVMNRQGQVIRKFMPPQGIRWGSRVCVDSVVVAPRGIIDAAVSPAGTTISYVSQWYFRYCDRVDQPTRARAAHIDGSNAIQIEM